MVTLSFKENFRGRNFGGSLKNPFLNDLFRKKEGKNRQKLADQEKIEIWRELILADRE